MEFKYYIIIACILLGLFLFFKEISRQNKGQLIFRLLATLTMVLGFALLILPVSYNEKIEEPIGELNLVTQGVNSDTIAKISSQKFTLDSSVLKANSRSQINFIPDLVYHLQEHPSIKKINIFGYGLGDEELAALKNHQVAFHPADVPEGIISASWPKKINATSPLRLQGIYNNSSNKNIWLKLYGMGFTQDSMLVKANTNVNFSLKAQPKQIGKAVYEIIALHKNDTLANEAIPFEVNLKQQLKVLILASFPDFEYKFLKKWMYENQYEVIFRSQISKNNYSVDYLNTSTTNVNQINSSLLKKQDILIIDEDEFNALTASESVLINAAVADGLGLLIRITNAKASGLTQKFKRAETLQTTSKTTQLKDVTGEVEFNELPFEQTLFLTTSVDEQPIFRTTAGKTIVNSSINGLGKILTSTLTSTYQWQLSGKDADYAKFWSVLLNKAARKINAEQSFEILPAMLAVNDGGRLIVNSVSNQIPSLKFNNIKLAPRQNMEISYQWDARFWPSQPGWNSMTINKSDVNVFVYQNSDWEQLKNANKLNLTSNFVKKQDAIADQEEKVINTISKEVSKWWFLLLFLFSLTYLWYEQRFLSGI
ncbi:hypothetical protein [Pedobacter cryotolerans]|uniref:Aerotolerance regulator N-terminal domain-containing protein n=1 Tax=Pedobacter cryotolerans TaxID=2571270 RepID=A0A4V5NZD7_9SPHI|nr:hypothetical protein [Pedobacter cryotolerans]TKB99474.1 hypothetical protein FA045_13415 [Pedobacter cryotolerans]